MEEEAANGFERTDDEEEPKSVADGEEGVKGFEKLAEEPSVNMNSCFTS